MNQFQRFLAVTLLLNCCSVSFCDDWPQFLGENRNGISLETGLVDSWPESNFKVAWKQPVGTGMSGCSILGQRVVTMGQDDQVQYVVCLGAADGKELWRTPISKAFMNAQGNGPRATPAIVDDGVFAYSGDGVMSRLNLKTGEKIWSVDTGQKFSGKGAEYGLASSPLVTDDHVVFQLEANDHGVQAKTVCLNMESGELNWTSVATAGNLMAELDGNGKEEVGYCSPTLMPFEGRPHVLTMTGSFIKIFELSSGRLIAAEKFETDYACNTATPVVLEDGQFFISAGENHGCGVFQIKRKNGDVILAKIWTSLGPKSIMRNEWQTSIRQGDFLFGFDNQGSAGPITNLACINWRTGEQAWKKARFGKGNMIFADGKFWMSNMDGELILGKLDAEKFVEVGRQSVTDSTRQAPSLANGFLYFRGNDSVTCVDVRKISYEK